MSNSSYSQKQLDVINTFGKDKLTLHVGPYGCGKTYIAEVALGLICIKLQKHKVEGLNIVLLGKTQQTVKKNQCNVLSSLWGDNFRYDSSRSDGKTKDATMFGQYIHIVGLNDKSSESKFRGISNIFCILHDEAIFCTEEQFNAIQSRLRGEFSDYQNKVFEQLGITPCFYVASTNPDSPMHWLKRAIDNNLFDKHVIWTMEDAKWDGAEEYYGRLKKLYPVGSLDYNRYIMGRWVAAEGSIFTYFLEHKDSLVTNYSDVNKNNIAFAYAGLDFGGNKSGSSLVFTGFNQNIDDGMVVLQSNKLIAAKGEIDPTRLNQWCIEQFRLFRARYPNIPIIGLDCDCAEQYLEQGVRIALNSSLGYTVPVGDSLKGSIIDRVKFIQKMFALQKLHIVGDMAPEVVNSLSTLVWDEHSQKDTVRDKGDTDNDTFDGFCYSFTRQMSRFDFL